MTAKRPTWVTRIATVATWTAVLLLFLTMVSLQSIATAPPFPACDDPGARAALGHVYDNIRLVYAARIDELAIVSESFTVRHCRAAVTWSDGSKRPIGYEFDVSGYGKYSRPGVSMWIDLNGGMRSMTFARTDGR